MGDLIEMERWLVRGAGLLRVALEESTTPENYQFWVYQLDEWETKLQLVRDRLAQEGVVA